MICTLLIVGTIAFRMGTGISSLFASCLWLTISRLPEVTLGISQSFWKVEFSFFFFFFFLGINHVILYQGSSQCYKGLLGLSNQNLSVKCGWRTLAPSVSENSLCFLHIYDSKDNVTFLLPHCLSHGILSTTCKVI